MTIIVYDSLGELTTTGRTEGEEAFVKADNGIYRFFNFSLEQQYSYEFTGIDKFDVTTPFTNLTQDSFSIEFWALKTKAASSHVFNAFIPRYDSIYDAQANILSTIGNAATAEISYYADDSFQSSLHLMNNDDILITDSAFDSLPEFSSITIDYAYNKTSAEKDETILSISNTETLTQSLVVDADGYVSNGTRYDFVDSELVDQGSWNHNRIVFDGLEYHFYKDSILLADSRTVDWFDSGVINIANLDLKENASFSFRTTFSADSDSSRVLVLGSEANQVVVKTTNFGDNLVLTSGKKDSSMTVTHVIDQPSITDPHVISFDVRLNPGRIRLWVDSAYIGFDSGFFIKDRWASGNFFPLVSYPDGENFSGNLYRSPSMFTDETKNASDGREKYSRVQLPKQTLTDNADGTFDYRYKYPAVYQESAKISEPKYRYDFGAAYGGWSNNSYANRWYSYMYYWRERRKGSDFFDLQDLRIKWRDPGVLPAENERVYYFELDTSQGQPTTNHITLLPFLTDDAYEYNAPPFFQSNNEQNQGHLHGFGDGIIRSNNSHSPKVADAYKNRTTEVHSFQSAENTSSSVEYMISEPDQKVFIFKKGVFLSSVDFPPENISGFLKLIFARGWYAKNLGNANHAGAGSADTVSFIWGSRYNYTEAHYANRTRFDQDYVKLRVSPSTWQYDPSETALNLPGVTAITDLGYYATGRYREWNADQKSKLLYNRQIFSDTSAGDPKRLHIGGDILDYDTKLNNRYFQGFNISADENYGNIPTSIVPDDNTKLNIVSKSNGGTVLSYNMDGNFTISDGLNRTKHKLSLFDDPNFGRLILDNSNGSIFDRSLTINGLKIVVAGAVGNQLSVPDEHAKKAARVFQLMTQKENEYKDNLIKTLRGDVGTRHAGFPTAQRIAYGGGNEYSPNFLTDDGAATYSGYQDFLNSHAVNDMIWYKNVDGPNPSEQNNDIEEMIEHLFHTIHLYGLPGAVPGSSNALNWNATSNVNFTSTELHAAMKEAIDNTVYDPSDYALYWNIEAEGAELAYKEYMYLLNWGMWEMSEFWNGGSLAPEWDDGMRTPAGIQANNPLGYALFNTYFDPVLSKPDFSTLRSIFLDNNEGISNYKPGPSTDVWRHVSFNYKSDSGGKFDIFLDGANQNITNNNLNLSLDALKLSNVSLGSKDSFNKSLGIYEEAIGNFYLHEFLIKNITQNSDSDINIPQEAQTEDGNTLLLTANNAGQIITANDVSPYTAEDFIWKRVSSMNPDAFGNDSAVESRPFNEYGEISTGNVAVNNISTSINYNDTFRTVLGDSFNRSSHLVTLNAFDDIGDSIDWSYEVREFSNPIIQMAYDSSRTQFYVKAYDLTESNITKECFVSFLGKHPDSGDKHPHLLSAFRNNDSYSSDLMFQCVYSGDLGLEVGSVSDEQLFRFIEIGQAIGFDSTSFIFDPVEGS